MRGALRRAEHGSASPSRRAQSEPGMGAALAPRSAAAVRPCDRAAVIHDPLFSTGLTPRFTRRPERDQREREGRSRASAGYAAFATFANLSPGTDLFYNEWIEAAPHLLFCA